MLTDVPLQILLDVLFAALEYNANLKHTLIIMADCIPVVCI